MVVECDRRIKYLVTDTGYDFHEDTLNKDVRIVAESTSGGTQVNVFEDWSGKTGRKVIASVMAENVAQVVYAE